MRWRLSIRRSCWRVYRVNFEAVTVAALLGDAAQRLATVLGLDSRTARIEARVLAAHVLKVEPVWLLAHDTDIPNAAGRADFRGLLERRLAGEPIAYLTGWREFYGHALRVTPDVLIPRPETELLVERALARIPRDTGFDVLELGCGSGCIAISLALERPRARITAIDCSAAALDIARGNADRLHASVEFLTSHWYSGLVGRQFDMIVANPPYVVSDDWHLAQGDVRYEPLGALASGIDGLDALRHIVEGAHVYLRPQGHLLLEHGYDQAPAVRALLTSAGMASIETWPDMAGVLRASGGKVSA